MHNDRAFAFPHSANMDDERNFLRQWREHAKLSQDELAEKAGTTKSVISLLENEKRPLSSKWLRKFAEILGTTPGRIMDIDPTEADADILDTWQHIPKAQRSQAMQILRTFRTGTDD